jgi:hypothetical protein
MTTPNYKPGDRVRVTVEGVASVASGNVMHVSYETPSGSTAGVTVVPSAAAVSVEVLGPVEWPPQRGDLWRDAQGDLWWAVQRGDKVLLTFSGDTASPADYVMRDCGPVTLAYREPTVDDD